MPRATVDFSILIPTHNRCAILRRALESLRQIRIPEGRTCELVVVANRCTDDTVAMVAASEGLSFPVRCVREEQAGASAARNRAIEEARGEILVFVDDDVWIEPDWLLGLEEVFATRPADLVAGRVVLWWEAVAKPAWMTTRSEHLLSCVDYGDQIVELTKPGLAVSANVAVRRSVIAQIGGFQPGLDRMPNAPLAGGDTEFFARALDHGCRMFYAPRAGLKHWVAPHRVTWEYLSAVAYGVGLARPFLRREFGLGRAVGTFASQAFRVAAYAGLLEPWARVLGREKARIHLRIRRRTAQGQLVGAWRRLRGLPQAGR